MDTKLAKTIKEAKTIFDSCRTRFLITRYNQYNPSTDDLDILVRHNKFAKTIQEFHKYGYKVSSHDHALGGRLAGYQTNLTKKGRIKIDLHKDFTWRKSKYIDLDFIWDSSIKDNKFKNIQRPRKDVDQLLILINIIFEKTYINGYDWSYLSPDIKKIFSTPLFTQQARTYRWENTFLKFQNWFLAQQPTQSSFPIFLPITLILYSYYEKLTKSRRIDLVSLSYYIFFRIRYLITQTLPYE